MERASHKGALFLLGSSVFRIDLDMLTIMCNFA